MELNDNNQGNLPLNEGQKTDNRIDSNSINREELKRELNKHAGIEGVPHTQILNNLLKQIKALLLETATKDGGDSILTIQETSEFLHVQKQTLYSYVSKGLIPNHKKAGRLYFLKDELINWIKSGNKRAFDVEAEAKRIIAKRKGGKNA